MAGYVRQQRILGRFAGIIFCRPSVFQDEAQIWFDILNQAQGEKAFGEPLTAPPAAPFPPRLSSGAPTLASTLPFRAHWRARRANF
jgi:hypothetical protein